MPVVEFTTAPNGSQGKANDLALAIKWWNAGYHTHAVLNVLVARDIASIEHKSIGSREVITRARLAVAQVVNAKTVDELPGGITGAIGGTINEAVGTVTNPLESFADFVRLLSDVKTWIRVGQVIGGSVVLLVGLRMLAREVGAPVPSLPRLPARARRAVETTEQVAEGVSK